MNSIEIFMGLQGWKEQLQPNLILLLLNKTNKIHLAIPAPISISYDWKQPLQFCRSQVMKTGQSPFPGNESWSTDLSRKSHRRPDNWTQISSKKSDAFRYVLFLSLSCNSTVKSSFSFSTAVNFVAIKVIRIVKFQEAVWYIRQICTFPHSFMVFFSEGVNICCEVYWDLEMKHGFIDVIEQIRNRTILPKENKQTNKHQTHNTNTLLWEWDLF